MANAIIARGLIPVRYIWGGYYTGSGNLYYVPSSYGTALYVGDPVDIVSGSNDANGIPAVQLATVGSPVLGVIQSIISGGSPPIAVTRDLPVYHPASTAQYILVCDDPSVLHEVQDDGSTQATAPNLWAGKNANLVSGTGSTTTGYSGWQLAASTVATTNTLDVKIIRPVDRPDNLVSGTANTNMRAKWLVKLNNSRFANQIAGV